jgi:hypothetical protein
MNYLQWIELIESFYQFKRQAKRINLHEKELQDIEQSIIELNPNAKR